MTKANMGEFGSMGPAKFRTLREAMGMTPNWIASQLGVSLRTVQRWESTMAPADFAAKFLEDWWERFAVSVEVALDGLDSVEGEIDHVADGIELVRYRSDDQAVKSGELDMTAQMHAALLGHVTMALKAEGYPVRISYRKEDIS